MFVGFLRDIANGDATDPLAQDEAPDGGGEFRHPRVSRGRRAMNRRRFLASSAALAAAPHVYAAQPTPKPQLATPHAATEWPATP